MATSIQAPQRKRDSVSNAANSTQIKRVLKPTVGSASAETNKASSSDQNRHLSNHLKPAKRSPPHESFRYVKKDGQNQRNLATQGTPRTAGRTSPSPVAKPHHERVTKASKPGKIHQLYVKKTSLLSKGKETQDPAALTEISKDVAVDPVSQAGSPKTKKGETFVKEMKKVEPVEEEVTTPTEPVAETMNVIVDASVSVGNREEERKKLQISDISTGSEEEEEKQSPSADEPSESLAEKEKDKKGYEELEETAEEEDGKRSTEERKGEEENRKVGKQGSAGGGKGKGESAPAYNEMIEETARKLVVAERKNKVKALVGAFETVINHESSSKSL